MYTLTRPDARRRSETVRLDSIDVEVDLRDAPEDAAESFPVTSTLTVMFSDTATFIDVVGVVDSVLVDGHPHPFEHDGSRLDLRDLPTGRTLTLTVAAHCFYSHTGEGLHRYRDPEDGRLYLYTQFEPCDARRAWPCFDQPDLKARWTFTVLAPREWVVASNGAGEPPEDIDDGRRHSFTTTPPLSSYITAVVAGEWAVVDGGTWTAPDTDDDHPGLRVPLRLLCRRALRPFMDADDILEVTRGGMDFYHGQYRPDYPWGTYDQVFVPEYNLGAMENPGCVTLNEHYLSRDTPTFAERQNRANTILHEMCHMWFGDLVTPAWWDDLWLKESFADHQGTLAASSATRYTGEWASFAIGRKAWAYEQDQYPTTHPIAADVPDVDAAKNNFDGITYAKGAAVLKQLFAWVGEDAFFSGARRYFEEHAFAPATLRDLLSALQVESGIDLGEWEQAWLHTTGPSVLTTEVETGDGGGITRFDVVQSAPTGMETVLRPHELVVSTWRLGEGTLTRTHRFPVRLEQACAPIDPEGVLARPGANEDLDLVVVNDEDLTYAVSRLDERSTRTALDAIGTCPDPLTRAVVWASLWNAVRDGLLPSSDFVRSALVHARTEPDDAIVERLRVMITQATSDFTPGSGRHELWRSAFETALEVISGSVEPDRARTWIRLLLTSFNGLSAPDESSIAVVRSLAEGSLGDLPVGPDLAWSARTALAAHGLVGESDLDAWLSESDTGEARVHCVRARAAVPTASTRSEAWKSLFAPGIPNEMLSATLAGLAASSWRGTELTDEFFASVLPFWREHSIGMGIRFVNGAFPGDVDADDPARSDDLVESARAWLADNHDAPAALVRLMREHLDDVERFLRGQGSSR